MTNPSPNMRGLAARGNAPSGWIGEWVNDWIRATIKGEVWVQGPMPRFPTIIKKREVLARTGLCNVTLWAKEKKGTFPKRFPLIDRAAERSNEAAE